MLQWFGGGVSCLAGALFWLQAARGDSGFLQGRRAWIAALFIGVASVFALWEAVSESSGGAGLLALGTGLTATGLAANILVRRAKSTVRQQKGLDADSQTS